MADGSVVLPCLFHRVAHVLLHALNPRHRTLALSTDETPTIGVPLLRRRDEELRTISKLGVQPEKVIFHCPFLQRG